MVTTTRHCLVALALALATIAFIHDARAADTPAPIRLDQGWGTAQEHTFYYLTQGTVLMPASWLLALQAPDGNPFASSDHLRRLGFIYDDNPSADNPHGWPIGFAVQSGPLTGGVPTVGITCAACHTSQINYRGHSLRIDGGQAYIRLDAFKSELTAALLATGRDPQRRAEFESRAVAAGFPKDRIAAAFNARYRALVASAKERATEDASATPAGPGRNDALAIIARQLFKYGIAVPSNTNKADAPVDFPYLWNIWNFDWVQYNAVAHQPMGRNIGEALGVGAVTHFVDPATGEVSPLPERWRTSIPVRNVYAIEALLTTLKPPHWPSAVLGPIDAARAARGRTLFAQNCAACHAVRALRDSPHEEWTLKVIPLEKIGTDPRQAENFRNTTYDGSKLGLSTHATAAEGLLYATTQIRDQAYHDQKVPSQEWPEFDGFGRKNLVAAPCGYKARPLVGVWATPPFLHNGSVPTVFDLLSESRPRVFHTGSLEYDPLHLGFVDAAGPRAFTLDTSVVGNGNGGHWFTNDRSRPGRIGRGLSDAEKFDIIEYLKGASYETYPRVTVSKPDPLPCVASAY